jgi:hypothetical protein
METDSTNNPIVRAKADLAGLEHKISVIKAEEDRLAAERQNWEAERNKIVSFIEMYQKYAVSPSINLTTTCEAHVPINASMGNGIDHSNGSVGSIGYSGKETRNSRNRKPPVHIKPPGTPTTYEMILAALLEAQERGLRGLMPKDIGEFIRQKWWPHLKDSSVGPAAWRMYKEDLLQKSSAGLYMLPSASP